MHPQHEKELNELKERMLKTEDLAKKFPLFESVIIKNKMVESDLMRFGDYYKKLYLPWGIIRGLYKTGERTPSNFGKDYDGYLWNIYVNTLTMYDSHEKFGLHDLKEHVFYLDDLNSTFYCTDEQIENFLDRLNDWFLSACEKLKEINRVEKIKKLEEELENARKENL